MFVIQYIHLLDGINHVFVPSYVKDKNCDFVNEDSFYSKY